MRPHEGPERVSIGASLHARGASVSVVALAPFELHAVRREDPVRRLQLSLQERFVSDGLALFPRHV